VNRLHRVFVFLLALIVVQPSHAVISPDSPLTQVKSVAAGETYRRTIAIRNPGDTVAEVRIYQTDYRFWADGRNEYGTPGGLPRSNARWIRLNQEQISVPAHDRGQVDYEVRVPEDAALVGTYWSAIMIEEVSAPAEEHSARRNEAQLRQVIRYALQVITEIGETGKGEIAFHDPKLTNEKGGRVLTVDIENTGERWLQTNVWLELRDSDGHPAGKFAGPRLRTFPGTSVRNRIDLSTASPGKYLALLVADGGRDDLFGAQIDLDLH
jgi:hypothetical protein